MISEPERHFGNHRPLGEDRVDQLAVLGRIDVLMAAGEHRDGAGGEAGTVRRRIDAAGKPGDDGKAGLAKLTRQSLGELHAGRRRVARTDDGDHRVGEG